MFEILKRDGLARICRFDTKHGTLETPALLPVLNPRLITIPPSVMKEELGFQALITNSYIIRNDPVLRQAALEKGVHQLIGYDGIVMTDSGTFQSHMYGEVELVNKDIVAFQRDIGSDIGTVLDIFTEPDWGPEKTRQAVDETLHRTKEAASIKGEMKLAGVVQGSVYPDQRESCAREMASMDVDVHPIGGVVPLMERYRFADLVDVIIASKKGLMPARPVHLFGAGHPMVFALAILLGCDMFDSASYAKFARDDRLMFPEGTMHLADMKTLECECPACRAHTLESLAALPDKERMLALAKHNLYASKKEIERAKRAMHEGTLWELVETRCRSHPALLDGLRRLREHRKYLERFEPLSREGAMFYTGPESLNRPCFLRYEERYFERYRQPPNKILVGFEDAERPYSRTYAPLMAKLSDVADAHFLVMSPFGPVPIELDEVYPIAQSLFPKIKDREMEEHVKEMMEHFSHCQQYGMCLLYDGEGTVEMLSSLSGEKSDFDIDVAKVRAVADYQFGKGAADALFDGKMQIVKSKNTDKIRNVLVDGQHVVSMRAPDGLFTLRPAGAKKLQKKFPSPRMRVIVNADSAEFNKEGKNVFGGFVLDCDPELIPMDEVLVVNEADELIAIGRTVLVRNEMLAVKKGLVVKVREAVA